MKLKLIDLETAKLAKEVGFDWKCIWFYYKGDLIRSLEHGYISDQSELLNHNHGVLKHSAPEQALLQKWLHEVHDIFIKVDRRNVDASTTFTSGWMYFPSVNARVPYERYGTVEEALEAGLHQGIKMIKNEKQK